MREYLKSFFSDFEYDEADASVLLDAYDRICNSPEAVAVWNEALSEYERDVRCDYKTILAKAGEAAEKSAVHEYTAKLLIFICMSKRLRSLYVERGVDLSIYHNTMLDLKYKLDECKLIKGVVGSFVASWFPRFFYLDRVALGRLQFEINKFGKNYEKNGVILTPDSPVINIHIPRTGTPLSPERCDEAFAMAKEYFGSNFDGKCVFHCSSWLLYPEHLNILSEKSNVYKFMSRFDIFESKVDETNVNLWRIFDTDERDVDKLPTDSFLRRAYVDHLKKGGCLGGGTGVFFM